MSIDFTGTTHNGNAVTTVIAYDESAGLLVFSASHSDGTNLYYDYDISKGCAVSNKIYYSGMTPNGKTLDGTGEYNISTYKDMEQLTFSLDGMDHSAIFDEFCSEYVGLATRAWLLQIREALGFSLADIGYSSF